MASAKLDLVRSIYGAWERGDYTDAGWADDEIEYVIVGGPAPGSWSGRAGLTEGWLGFVNAWEDLRVTEPEYRELDQERVLVTNRFTGRGKTSGLELEDMGEIVASVFHLRGGKVIRLVQYFDADRALAELGLSE